MPTPAEWLGLCLRSESEQPHEWPYLGCVVRNRVESSRFASTYAEVITQPYQFSYFNDYLGLADLDQVYAAASQGYAGDDSGWPHNDLVEAVDCARWLIAASRWELPLSRRVLYFWSPRSMQPRGSDPSWARNLYRVFTPACVDRDRWRFGQESA